METIVMYYMNRIIKVGCLMYLYATILVLVSRHGIFILFCLVLELRMCICVSHC